MRYRIVIEVDVDDSVPRDIVNGLAERASDECVIKFSTPVYLSTEKVEANKDVLKG